MTNLKNSAEVLNFLKSEKAVDWVIVNDSDKVLANKDTNNLQNVYKINDFYGVYGDAIDNNQIDSRTNSDEEILSAIEKMLTLGNLFDRNKLENDNSTNTPRGNNRFYFWK